MTFDDAVDLFAQRSDLQVSTREVAYCYGMSKMTCANETDGAAGKYMRLQFVEFLEMIGRVADLKFRGSELETIPLQTKIEYVLDDLFATAPGLERRDARGPLAEETDSDSAY